MEIALSPDIPTYCGGLGVLAGDTLRSAADLSLPLVAVTLLHRKGYFFQKLDSDGRQTEEVVYWKVEDFFQEMGGRGMIEVDGREVFLRAWKYTVKGRGARNVEVFLLDTDLPENDPMDRSLTDQLYGGEPIYRLAQEIVLGIGGIRMLRVLGYDNIRRYHLNEGHASLLTLELLDEEIRRLGETELSESALSAVRQKCVFTTHTPVSAGHDLFSINLAKQLLSPKNIRYIEQRFLQDGCLNMTHLALQNSHYVNGVAKQHGKVSRKMFVNYVIDSITNGVHATTWVCRPFAELFDRFITGWREDNASLRYAAGLPRAEIWNAHRSAKKALLDFIAERLGVALDLDAFTIGFARRVTAYKRPDLVFGDIERLRKIAKSTGKLQFIFGGKAHPHDRHGKELIEKIFAAAKHLSNDIKIVYLPNYDMHIASRLTAGVDLWLNNPQPPMEASGTSGMKAALNGVPSLSVLDGWWIEGCIEGITGWAIGNSNEISHDGHLAASHAEDLYNRLENTILPMYYNNANDYIQVMRSAIALNGSFFSTERMMFEYVLKAYY
ncbi:MAG: alpha-glucan family phosphorylase [Deltaproteobacteria bacterium]|nr:alpha-glucan family phosphorylase [Deltaproteobacteria bacterium]